MADIARLSREVEKSASFADIVNLFKASFRGHRMGYIEKEFALADDIKAAFRGLEQARGTNERYDAGVRLKVARDKAAGTSAEDMAGLYGKISPLMMQKMPTPKQLGQFNYDRYHGAGAKLSSRAEDVVREYAEKKADLDERIENVSDFVNISRKEIQKKTDEALRRAAETAGYEDIAKDVASLDSAWQSISYDLFDKLKSAQGDEYLKVEVERSRAYDKYLAERNVLLAKRVKIRSDIFDPIYAEANEESRAQNADRLAQLDKLKAEREALKSEVHKAMDEILVAAAGKGTVTAKEAKAWADHQIIDKQVGNRLKKNGSYSLEELKKDLAEFYRLTGGKMKEVRIASNGSRRANAGNGVVHIDGNFSKRTLFHELGHILEEDGKIQALAHHFIDVRTDNRKAPIRSLRSLTGWSTYRSGEKAYDAGFFHPYAGKVYSWGSTEIISMGIQQFSDPEMMLELYTKDRDHFNFVLGLIATEDEADVKKRQVVAEANAKAQEFFKELDKVIKTVDWGPKGDTLDSVRYPSGWPVATRTVTDGDSPAKVFGRYRGFIVFEAYTRKRGSRRFVKAFAVSPMDAEGNPTDIDPSTTLKTEKEGKRYAYMIAHGKVDGLREVENQKAPSWYLMGEPIPEP